MSNMAKQQVVNSLGEKIGRVIEDNTRLRKECDDLSAEKERLRAENRQLQEKIATLQRKLSLLELGEGLGGTQDEAAKKRARAQINRLMREIDRCIALVSK